MKVKILLIYFLNNWCLLKFCLKYFEKFDMHDEYVELLSEFYFKRVSIIKVVNYHMKHATTNVVELLFSMVKPGSSIVE